MKAKFSKYENELRNPLSLFATILDPRLNIKYFKPNEANSLKNAFIDYFGKYYDNSVLIEEYEENETQTLFQSIYKKRKVMDSKEIERYLDLPQMNSSIDLINWWENQKTSFSSLYKMAIDILNIPATSVPSEQIFSKAGEVVSKSRNRLSKDSIQALMCSESMIKYFNSE
jgi:hypothetical protein